MEKICSTLIIAGVGLAHLVPGSAVLSRRRIETTYAVAVSDPDLELLLRHRAALFALLGAGLLESAAVPRHRPVAIPAGFVSLGSYVFLAREVGTTNARLRQVSRVDITLLAALAGAAALDRRGR